MFLQIIKLILFFVLNILKWLFSVGGSQVIYNLGLGIGGLLGGLAGLRYINEWLEKLHRTQLVKGYQRMYPKSMEDNKKEGWELSHNPERKGHLYLLDHRNKTRHWIANMRTFQDLFVNVPEYDNASKDIFSQYQESVPILTVGHPEP